MVLFFLPKATVEVLPLPRGETSNLDRRPNLNIFGRLCVCVYVSCVCMSHITYITVGFPPGAAAGADRVDGAQRWHAAGTVRPHRPGVSPADRRRLGPLRVPGDMVQ